MSDPGAEPRLVVPEGLVIDESARERLVRQLGGGAAGGGRCRGRDRRARAGRELPRPRRMGRARLDLVERRGRVRARRRAGARRRPAPPARGVRGTRRPGRGRGRRRSSSTRARTCTIRSARSGRCCPRPSAAGRRSRGDRWWCSSRASRASDADWVRRLVNRLVRRDVEARIALPQSRRPATRPPGCTSRARASPRRRRSARSRPTSS